MLQITKLCLVIPSLQAGGMERVMCELAGYFCSKQNLEPHLILYGKTCEVFYNLPQQLILHKPKNRFNKNLRFISSLDRLLYLRRTVKSIDPASILSFGEIWNSFVLLALSGLHYPVYISDRCSPERSYSFFHRILRKFLYPKSEGIIAQTNIAKTIYSKIYRHPNIEVIGNPIRSINPGQIPRENIVLSVGRLITSKHHDKLIEMFLNVARPSWRLVIVGYDHLQQKNYDRLQEIILRRNATDRVILAGKQNHVDNYYRKSKIFAFASSSEGFPNVIGEAMSAGLPVIAFDCVAGPAEMIVNNQNGFLVSLFDYSQFQRKLELLMEDDILRDTMGKNALNDIKNQFSIEKVGEKYFQFIRKQQISQ